MISSFVDITVAAPDKACLVHNGTCCPAGRHGAEHGVRIQRLRGLAWRHTGCRRRHLQWWALAEPYAVLLTMCYSACRLASSTQGCHVFTEQTHLLDDCTCSKWHTFKLAVGTAPILTQ